VIFLKLFSQDQNVTSCLFEKQDQPHLDLYGTGQKVFYAFIQGHQSAAALRTAHRIPFNLLDALCPPALQVLLLRVGVS